MDQDARNYQNQLHNANQERMKSFETKLDKVLETVTRVDVAVVGFPELEKRVAALENDKSFRKGVLAVLVFLGSLIGAGIGEAAKAIFHYFYGK